MSLDNIMRHPLAIIVHDGNFCLSDSLSLVCGQTEPSQGLLIVFRDSLSIKIQRPQVELRLGLPLYHRFFIPLPCLNIVPWHASAFAIQHPQVVLREGISLLGQRSPRLLASIPA